MNKTLTTELINNLYNKGFRVITVTTSRGSRFNHVIADHLPRFIATHAAKCGQHWAVYTS